MIHIAALHISSYSAYFQISLTILSLSLGHLFNEMHDGAKRWPSDKVKENCDTYLKIYTILCSYVQYASLARL